MMSNYLHKTLKLMLGIHLGLYYLPIGEARAKGRDDFVRVNVPAWVRESETAKLYCDYDVDDDKLYSLNWYKGAQEFFRYTPKEIPPFKTFPPFGNHVNLKASNSSVVTLDIIGLNMTDKYTCEVTKDFPDYTTSFRSANLHVVSPPQGPPVISPAIASVRVGEVLAINCTSRPSKPAAKLRWLLNGFEVEPNYLGVEEFRKDINGKETVTLGLNFTVQQQDFIKDRITISCRSTLEPNLHDISAKINIMNKFLQGEHTSQNNYSQPGNRFLHDTKSAGYTFGAGGIVWSVRTLWITLTNILLVELGICLNWL